MLLLISPLSEAYRRAASAIIHTPLDKERSPEELVSLSEDQFELGGANYEIGVFAQAGRPLAKPTAKLCCCFVRRHHHHQVTYFRIAGRGLLPARLTQPGRQREPYAGAREHLRSRALD